MIPQLSPGELHRWRLDAQRESPVLIDVHASAGNSTIAASRGRRASDADAIRREFDCLRDRHLEVLGERSFLHAVLVRLVKYFWDDENLRIVEAGSRAAQDFLREEERMPAPPGAKAPPLPAPPAAPPAPAKRDAVPPAPKASEKPSEVGRLAPPAERLRAEYKPLRPKGA